VIADRLPDQLRAAFAAAEDESETPLDRAEMLVEIAMSLQQRPKTPQHLFGAVELYDRALALSPVDETLLRARITARKATALQALPDEGTISLEAARDAFEAAAPVLAALGSPAELAEAEMNLGLVLQYLAGMGKARIGDAIAAYQRALRTFDRRRFPAEFAILQNNLATAFLSMPLGDERGKMREALAVQSFEDGLSVVNLIDHPAEYAMLQNNLGNALQYAGSSHTIENNLRAIEAYDEALKVRTRAAAPLEYANTIANKANCLRVLPDDPAQPESGNGTNLTQAKAYYAEAREIFATHGESGKAQLVDEPLAELERELLALATVGAPA
jgi:tetratricopeptide (TPR) repeat protein